MAIAAQEVDVDVAGRRALVTGANRGLGEQFVAALLARGVDRVYAGARDPETLMPLLTRHGDRVVPVRLDVTETADLRAVAEGYDDIDLVVSNAGQACVGPVLAGSDDGRFRSVFEVNFFGPLALVRALGPHLRARRGGVLFVLSLAALVISRSSPVYSASKAAAMMLATAVRSELKADGVVVTSSFPGFIDTDMTVGVDIPKASPRVVADRSLDAWQAERSTVFPDRLAELVEDAVLTNMAAVLENPQALMGELIRELRRDASA
jgi:NAD(P)-dependent dehydrogenase (short-subunit alcohol dehydrogenase family)